MSVRGYREGALGTGSRSVPGLGPASPFSYATASSGETWSSLVVRSMASLLAACVLRPVPAGQREDNALLQHYGLLQPLLRELYHVRQSDQTG